MNQVVNLKKPAVVLKHEEWLEIVQRTRADRNTYIPPKRIGKAKAEKVTITRKKAAKPRVSKKKAPGELSPAAAKRLLAQLLKGN